MAAVKQKKYPHTKFLENDLAVWSDLLLFPNFQF